MTEPSPADAAVDRILAAVRARPNLSVTADLTVHLDGTELQVTSYTDLLKVEIATVGDAVRVARSGRSELGRLASGLAAAGLTAEVLVGGSAVARIGADASPGLLVRRLTDAPIESLPGGAVGALLGSL